MKLLFDQNISFKLVKRLSHLFPASSHVRLEGLEQKDDWEVWEFAKNQGFTVVTQDADFFDLGLIHGQPPKVIWLRCGNTSTENIEHILIANFQLIQDFIQNLPQNCLELY